MGRFNVGLTLRDLAWFSFNKNWSLWKREYFYFRSVLFRCYCVSSNAAAKIVYNVKLQNPVQERKRNMDMNIRLEIWDEK